jgi:hypothetical protein
MATELQKGKAGRFLMTNRKFWTLAALFAVSVASSLWAQSSSKLTARELFYTPLPHSKAAVKKAAPKDVASTKKATPPKVPKKSPSQPSVPVNVEPGQPDVQLASQQGLDASDARFMNVANGSAIPLGLRYSILKYGANDEAVEVDPDMVFRSGDRIRLRVQVNDTGYLYIVTQGSSGNWRVLFPSAEFDDGNNRVTRDRSYEIPSRTRFVFDEQPGTEKLFLVLTRKPEHDLDKLIYQLDTPRDPEPADAPKAQKPPTLLALNTLTVSDDLVSQLRGTLVARDLVFEKVNEEKPARQSQHNPEKAVYVVNPARDASARLIVDVDLKHR